MPENPNGPYSHTVPPYSTEAAEPSQHHYISSLLLERIDREYTVYRSAILRALEAMHELPREAAMSLHTSLQNLEHRVARLESIAHLSSRDDDPFIRQEDGYAPAENHNGEVMKLNPSGRIRWGGNVSEIRQTIFQQLHRLESAGEPVTTETIKRYVPGMLRWLYGQQKIFEGIESLRSAYEQWKNDRGQQGQTAV